MFYCSINPIILRCHTTIFMNKFSNWFFLPILWRPFWKYANFIQLECWKLNFIIYSCSTHQSHHFEVSHDHIYKNVFIIEFFANFVAAILKICRKRSLKSKIGLAPDLTLNNYILATLMPNFMLSSKCERLW